MFERLQVEELRISLGVLGQVELDLMRLYLDGGVRLR